MKPYNAGGWLDERCGPVDAQVARDLVDLVLDHVEGRDLDVGIDDARRIFAEGETVPGMRAPAGKVVVCHGLNCTGQRSRWPLHIAPPIAERSMARLSRDAYPAQPMSMSAKGASVIGWGKCLPPAVLSNADIATFLDTSDEWIFSRTGIRERRVSHVSLGEMSYVAAARALACAGFDGSKIELIVFGSTSYDDQVPNMASGIQKRIGADGCAAMDVNTACTSFLYSLSTATALIRTGVVKNALVIGCELISPFMDWSDRNVAVLFGDGAAAVVLQATDKDEGLLAERLGCYGEAREILRVHGMGGAYAHQNRIFGKTEWQFEGQEIFKKAVHGMALAWPGGPGKDRQGCRRHRPGHSASGQLPHHRSGRQEDGHWHGTRVRQCREIRQHVCGHRAGGTLRSAGGRTGEARRLAADAVIRRRTHLHRSCRQMGRTRDTARHQ
jgi:3-oxoacyl-(acyl-carrier-protein) synthase III